MQRENIIIVILLAIILGGGGYVVYNHLQAQAAPVQETQPTPSPTVLPESTMSAGASGDISYENSDIVLSSPSSSDRLEIFAEPAEWDGNPGDDGIIVHFSFYDEKNQKKKFDGAILRTHVLVYTPDTDRHLVEVRPPKVLYNRYTTIASSSEGESYPLRGIRVPYNEMSFVSNDRGIGKIRVEVQVSQGTLVGEENYLYCR